MLLFGGAFPESVRQLADDSPLLLLPTAVGTSNDQKKQKVKAVHYTWLTKLLRKENLPSL